MKSKLLSGHGPGTRIFLLVLETGDEVVSTLEGFLRENNINAAAIQGVGALSNGVVGWFSPKDRNYQRIPANGQMEVLSLLGNVALNEDEPKLHAHVVLGSALGAVIGGHLIEGRVRPTLEVYVTEMPGYIKRKPNPEIGLPLIDLSGE
jgi:predicted DNA-binding protein with PD1-like motif